MDEVSFERVEVTGTPVELYAQTHLADILKFSICLTVPKEPVYTVLQHIFLKRVLLPCVLSGSHALVVGNILM